MIQEYKFNDDKIGVRAVGILNLILATILLLANISIGASQFLFDLRIQICLVIGIVYLGLCRYYDWRSVQMNVFAMIFYLFMIIIEILLLGIPGPILDNQPFNFSKGIMLELLLMGHTLSIYRLANRYDFAIGKDNL